MQRHNIPFEEEFISGDQVLNQWLGDRGLHITRIITQIFVGVVFNVSSHLYDFGCRSDCM
jgi:hypothetical protein